MAFLTYKRSCVENENVMATPSTLLKFALVLVALAVSLEGTSALPVSVQWPSSDTAENGCSLVFNIQKTSEGMPNLLSISMPPLEKLIESSANGMRKGACNLVFALQPIVQAVVPEGDNAVQPLHEEQLAVWPEEQDFEDIVEQGESEGTGGLPQVPLYEEQIVVFPDLNAEQDNFENDDDFGPTTLKPTVVAQQPIEVLENFQTTHPNGTIEYKLVLSNGVVNYKKMYTKVVNGKVVPVQEGYDSVPIAGRDDEFQIQYYIADEHGFHVYKIEHTSSRPELPTFLDYKQRMTLEKNKD